MIYVILLRINIMDKGHPQKETELLLEREKCLTLITHSFVLRAAGSIKMVPSVYTLLLKTIHISIPE